MSATPPGAKGTISVMGLLGNVLVACAKPRTGQAEAANRQWRRLIVILQVFDASCLPWSRMGARPGARSAAPLAGTPNALAIVQRSAASLLAVVGATQNGGPPTAPRASHRRHRGDLPTACRANDCACRVTAAFPDAGFIRGRPNEPQHHGVDGDVLHGPPTVARERPAAGGAARTLPPPPLQACRTSATQRGWPKSTHVQLLFQPVQHPVARQHLRHAGIRLATFANAAKTRSSSSIPFIETFEPWTRRSSRPCR